MITASKPAYIPTTTNKSYFNTQFDPFRPLGARKTDITIILDRSGSMGAIKQATEAGFNEFLNEQKKTEGEAFISLYQFDSEYEMVYNCLPIADAPPLRLEPRGMTALNDAMGRTIDATGRRLAKLRIQERPENVIILVLTDGQENASREYTVDRVAEMVKHQTDKYHWNFIFLGSNQDAVLTAGRYNITGTNALSYANTTSGVANVFNIASSAVTGSRLGNSISFTDEDRKEAMVDANTK